LIVHRLRLTLPLPAYGKPALVRFLRSCLPIERTSPRLTVTNVFYAGDDRGFMCHFVVDGAVGTARMFVAPIEQLAFDRRRPIIREKAARRGHNVNATVVNSLLDIGAQCPR
jgi:hypothetical protein